MSKQKQLLPATPRLENRADLFGGFGVVVHYEEYNRTSCSYRNKTVECADADEAAHAVEYLKCCRLLEPLIRFLIGQEQALLHDYGNQARRIPVTSIKKNLETLLLPKNQTCQRIAEFFYHGGGTQFTNAMPGKKSKYWQKANDLLSEIRSFTRQHMPVKSVAV